MMCSFLHNRERNTGAVVETACLNQMSGGTARFCRTDLQKAGIRAHREETGQTAQLLIAHRPFEFTFQLLPSLFDILILKLLEARSSVENLIPPLSVCSILLEDFLDKSIPEVRVKTGKDRIGPGTGFQIVCGVFVASVQDVVDGRRPEIWLPGG